MVLFGATVAFLGSSAATSTCEVANNFANAQYTIPLKVGSPAQQLRVVPDSGSSDLLLASTDCVGCTGEHMLFDRAKSTSFATMNARVESDYGQGSVISKVGYDKVALGSLAATNQSLLIMLKNELQNFQKATYDGVMGLGPQYGARTDDDDLSFLATLHQPIFSICFGQGDGQPGRLEVGGAIPGLEYQEMAARGQYHWGLYATKFAVQGSASVASQLLCAPHCAAIVDSGTSLIAVPSTMLVELAMAIGNVREDCSNIHELPNVEFTLEGQSFLLPPEMYIIRVRDDNSGSPAGVMQLKNVPPVFGLKGLTSKLKGKGGEVCMAGFMEMDAITNDGPMMILGVPFLRAFAAKFDRGKKTIGLAKIPVGSQKCTACADAKEGKEKEKGASAEPMRDLLPPVGAEKLAVSTPTLSLQHLRLPWWAAKAAGNATMPPARAFVL